MSPVVCGVLGVCASSNRWFGLIVLGVRQCFWKYLEVGIKKSIWGEPYNLIWVNLSAHIKQVGIMMTTTGGKSRSGPSVVIPANVHLL